jgi:hypothetical protein
MTPKGKFPETRLSVWHVKFDCLDDDSAPLSHLASPVQFHRQYRFSSMEESLRHAVSPCMDILV